MQAAPFIAEYGGAIMAAAGAAASIAAQQKADKERRGILNRQLERTDEATDKSTEIVEEQGKKFSQQARVEGLQEQEKKGYEQTQADLQGAGGAMVNPAAGAGAVSDDFLKAKAQKAVDEGTRMTTIAREAAKARAPGALGQKDALSMAGMAGDLQNLWGRTKNLGQATGLDAQNVTEPVYGSLGKIATAIGGKMQGGQGTSGVPPNPYASSGIGWGR